MLTQVTGLRTNGVLPGLRQMIPRGEAGADGIMNLEVKTTSMETGDNTTRQVEPGFAMMETTFITMLRVLGITQRARTTTQVLLMFITQLPAPLMRGLVLVDIAAEIGTRTMSRTTRKSFQDMVENNLES